MALPTATTALTDQTPPEDDLAAEDDVLGSKTGASREGMMRGPGHEADASGTLEAGIDLDWLQEPGCTQALSDRAAAYNDIGRCAYHPSPHGCTLVEGDADGPGLTELCGLTPAEPASVPPETRPGAVKKLRGARRRCITTGADLMTGLSNQTDLYGALPALARNDFSRKANRAPPRHCPLVNTPGRGF